MHGRTAVALLALMASSTAATAQQLLFSTLGPGESFTPGPGFTIGGGVLWNLSGNNGNIMAVAFIPAVTARFSRADFALEHWTTTDRDLTGPPELDVTLASDADGLPGGTLEAIHIANAFGGVINAVGVLSAPSALHPALLAGTQYWLVLAPTDLLHTAFSWLGGPASGAPNQNLPGQQVSTLTSKSQGWLTGNLPPGASYGFAVFGGSGVSAIAPSVSSNGIVSAASFTAPVSSGSWVSIFGSTLANTSRGWRASDFSGDALPVSLDGVSVLVDGIAAPVSYIGPGQVNAQIPDLDPSISTSPLQVVTPQGTSDPILIQVAPLSPALFVLSSNGVAYAAATLADGTVISPSNPVQPGQILALYGTGFGPSNPAIASGTVVAKPEPLAQAAGLMVTIGGIPADVSFAGIVGAGLDQFNVTVPPLPSGNQPLLVNVAGVSTQSGVMLPVAAQ